MSHEPFGPNRAAEEACRHLLAAARTRAPAFAFDGVLSLSIHRSDTPDSHRFILAAFDPASSERLWQGGVPASEPVAHDACLRIEEALTPLAIDEIGFSTLGGGVLLPSPSALYRLRSVARGVVLAALAPTGRHRTEADAVLCLRALGAESVARSGRGGEDARPIGRLIATTPPRYLEGLEVVAGRIQRQAGHRLDAALRALCPLWRGGSIAYLRAKLRLDTHSLSAHEAVDALSTFDTCGLAHIGRH